MSESSTATEEKVPTQAEIDYERAKGIISPLAKAGKDENEIGKALVLADFTISKAKRYRQLVLEDLGIILSSKNRFELASALLVKGDFKPQTWEEVEKACEYLAQELDATTENQAFKSIKRFCKANSIEIPDKPKGVRGRSPTSFRAISLTWMTENCDKSMDEFVAYMKEAGKDSESNRRYYGRIFEAIQSSYNQGFNAA
jgi:hypothetical protein